MEAGCQVSVCVVIAEYYKKMCMSNIKVIISSLEKTDLETFGQSFKLILATVVQFYSAALKNSEETRLDKVAIITEILIDSNVLLEKSRLRRWKACIIWKWKILTSFGQTEI